ncbi:hypothetical protein [Haematobacter sp.]|uniref:hypothetical protein n=1 Tax=Haematobacter sp. TaxID=2953762 RepID=UPI0028A9D371|nr:hypothetical protein [Haematobacter sp.]
MDWATFIPAHNPELLMRSGESHDNAALPLIERERIWYRTYKHARKAQHDVFDVWAPPPRRQTRQKLDAVTHQLLNDSGA